MSDTLFRKRALERLSSPEELDTLMQITSPAGWVSLIAIGMILIIIVIWSIFGAIPDKVQGEGILIRDVDEITSDIKGRVVQLLVERDQEVKKGEVVAKIQQIGVETDIKTTRDKIRDMKAQKGKEISAFKNNIELQKTADAERRRTLKNSISDLGIQIQGLDKIKKNQEGLLEKGLIPGKTLQGTISEIASLRNAKSQKEDELVQMNSDKAGQDRQFLEKETAFDAKLGDLERDLKNLESKQGTGSEIRSPSSGLVIEMKVKEGDLVEPHTGIISLERHEKDKAMQLVLYMPVEQGKKVKNDKDMEVHISPSTVKPEEYGFIIGKVKSVSKFPATPERMKSVLKHETLVKKLTGKSPPIEISVELEIDKKTPSGFKWTSSSGPPFVIDTGTVCVSFIVVDTKSPISYVIPTLKKTIGYM